MIDGGPLRTARQTGRQVVEYQDDPVRYQPEESQRVESVASAEQPRRSQQRQVVAQQAEPTTIVAKKPKNLSWVKWVVLIIILVAAAVSAWLFWPSTKNVEATIDPDKYQAVFLTNGQVYFGRLAVVDNDYMKLTNVYYLERQLTGTNEDSNKTPAEGDAANPTGDNNFQLLKYSDVLYGSEDAMVISRDDIIRYENLRSDGVVAKAIANRS